MVEKDTNIISLILRLSNDYVKHLGFANQENIESGKSGELLFLLTLYQQTHSSQHLEKIQTLANELISYCKNNPSGNYSLYTGRAGAAYVLIQLYYTIGKDIYYLEEAILMLAKCNESYLHSEHVSDYLYDGRAGTLLVLAQLHALSGKASLVPYVEFFIDKIVSNANFSMEGISWRNPWEIDIKDSCSFAFGAAGIKYVLDQINCIYSNAGLQYLSNGIGKFINHSWINANQNWACQKAIILNDGLLARYREMHAQRNLSLFVPLDEYGWATGAAGIWLACNKIDEPPYKDVETKLWTLVESGEIQSCSLFEGLAGIGLTRLRKFPENRAVKKKIVSDVLDKLLPHSDAAELEGGLLYGKMGWLYFLLQANNSQVMENVLAPVLNDRIPVTLGIKNISVKSGALLQYYPRSLALLKKIVPDDLHIYLEGPLEKEYVNEVLAFEAFFSEIMIHLKQGVQRECLNDIFCFEKNRQTFLLSEERSHLQFYLDESIRYEKAIDMLNQPYEHLLDEQLVISNTIEIISTAWNWSFANDFGAFDEPQVDRLEVSRGEFLYILQLSRNMEIVETFLRDDLLLLMKCFQRPCAIRHALEEVRSLVAGMPDYLLMQKLIPADGTADIKDFRINLNDIVLYEIKQWVLSGILRSI